MFGIKLPDLSIICSVIILSSYYHFNHFNPEFQMIGWIAIIAFLVHSIFNRETKGLILSLVTIAAIIFIVMLHLNHNQKFKINDTNEIQEYLFGMISFFYAAFLFADMKTSGKEGILKTA